MASTTEIWYIRLPDGRVLRARGTDQLRRILKSGRIPWESRVRQSTDDPWQTLERTPDFADLVPGENRTAEDAPAEGAARTAKPRGGAELQTLGMRGLVEELFNAFESTLQGTKLNAAACVGLGIGVVLVIAGVLIPLLPTDWIWAGYVGAALVLLILFNICSSILTQMTALELSRFRPAHFHEVRAGIVGYTVRLTCAMALVGGVMLALILLFRWLPGWLHPADTAQPGLAMDTLLNLVNGTRLLLEVICWPILGYALLMMGPIYIVEDYSIGRGLREWVNMLRQHIGRIYLYQAIAFAFAAIMTLPLIVPVLLAFGFAGGNPQTLSLGEMVPFYLLAGAALTPMLAYLLVAHVFIYLNLRYEFFYSARER
ncbi:MAG: hypothetical protein HY289_00715 [Planctomycetes bacterium]|nr:hypothetical protein [Planctomycetota bacterium]